MRRFLNYTLLKVFICGFVIPALGQQKPARVVALSPALTELIYALHLERKLVGVSDFSDYPSAAKSKRSVGPYTHPDFEVLLSLRPDLVLLPIEGPEDVRARLEHMHLNFKIIDMRNLDGVGLAAEKIGTWLGDKAGGASFRKKWSQDLERLFKSEEDSPRSSAPKVSPKVFVEIQNSPLIAAGAQTFFDEIVTRCGGKNGVTDIGYPHIAQEWVVPQKFDLVLLSDYFPSFTERDDAEKWWTKLPLTRSTPIVALNPDLTSRPGPRLLEGAKLICSAIKGVGRK